MSQIMSPPPRFTHGEWNVSNKSKYQNAESERRLAERLEDESGRLISETKERTDKSQADVDKKLDQRLSEIKYWRDELNAKLDGITRETEYLEQYVVRVEKAIEAVANPLHIAQQNLNNRERRIRIDLVHDDVQRNLIKEVETYQGVLELLQRTLEEGREQLRLNRKARYILGKDLTDKFSAELIDDKCHSLTNHSEGLVLAPGAAKIEANSTTPFEWRDFSDDNIKMAERERQNSQQMRSMIDATLQQVANDMNKQIDECNAAFDRRIWETRDAKNKLEAHLDKVKQQIRDMEQNMANLQLAIEDKKAPLSVATTRPRPPRRLCERSNRPNVELCRDPAQYRLVSEVSEIERSIAELQSRYADSKKSLQGLLRQQVDLEADIEAKTNTLFIDEADCMGARESIHVKPF